MDNAGIIKYGVVSGKTLYDRYVSNYSYNKQILDPLSCLIRVALLAFKEKGTKISIANNKIYFQTSDMLQGTKRWMNGDKRNDLHNLCNPIERAIEWFNPQDNEDIASIFKIAIIGLKNLRDAYVVHDIKVGDSNLVCHSISHYISLIEAKLEDNESEEIDNSIVNAMRHVWENEEITVINSLLKLAEKKQEKGIDYHSTIDAIEKMLSGKDKLIRILVSKLATSI